ncbi:MAG: head-tail joining protein [Thermodesulfobacteriota bacterium]|nr:head-tail joining protein [Thermodesulfobacteriota bacterium]
MAFTEDIDTFFNTDDFAVAATYTPLVGLPSTVNGIFDDEYFDEVGGSVGIEGSQPRFTCKLEDIAAVEQGDALTVSGVSYEIVNVQKDGTGIVVLVLEEQ